MAEDYKKLGQGTLTGDGSTVDTLYTVPIDTNVIIKEIRVTNKTGGAGYIEVYDVDTGGTAGDSNVIIPQIDIPDGGWLVEHGAITTTADASIKAVGEVALTYTLYGVEVT